MAASNGPPSLRGREARLSGTLGHTGGVREAAQFQGDEGDNCWPLASSQEGAAPSCIYIRGSAARAHRLHRSRGARGARGPCSPGGPDASDTKVNTDVQALHNATGPGSRPPFDADHANGKVPVYLNPRMAAGPGATLQCGEESWFAAKKRCSGEDYNL